MNGRATATERPGSRTIATARIIVPVMAALLVSACAGGMGTTRHTTLIETSPGKAVCDLRGGGYALRIETPARLEIPKAASPVAMTCRVAGYRPLQTTLTPQFNPKILGNFLLGSVTGIVSDMIGGHDEIYPTRLLLNLEPVAFASRTMRDRWFGRFRRATLIRWDMTLNDLRMSCDGHEDTICQSIVTGEEKKRDAELDSLERRRANAALAEPPDRSTMP